MKPTLANCQFASVVLHREMSGQRNVTGLFYATAFGLQLNDQLSTALTFVLGLALRLLAIRYKWEMPKFVFNGEQR